MKMSFSCSLILSLFISLANASDFKHIQLTDFTSNTPVNLATIDPSKATYIKMWATWCKPCMQQMPHFQNIYEKYGDKMNIFAVNININEEAKYIDEVIKKFGLTMPVLLDNDGLLGVELGLVGTPYSVLINTDANIVYTSHESDTILDTFIAKLAQGQKLESQQIDLLTEQEKNSLIQPWLQGDHTLFFSATWCDWYLKDSRPNMSANCEKIQTDINTLSKQSSAPLWHGFVNHLWTDQQSVDDFRQLYQIEFEVDIDIGGLLFNHFNIRQIPTIITIKEGKVISTLVAEEIYQLKKK